MNIKDQYKKACNFLEGLSQLDTPFSYMKNREVKDLQVYLERMQELLDKLDSPEKDMKFIHITGTSGKGTTVALTHNMLQNAGFKVGSTSSPATTTTLERIRVGDLYIDPKDFVRIVSILKPIVLDMYLNSEYGKPSYFDLVLAIALVYFKEQKCDYVVLEVGMGGRYDSTNIIKKPVVTAITNIHLDHTHLLGDSLSEIAYEKGGIIKPGSKFFTTEKSKENLGVFHDICLEQQVLLDVVNYENKPNQALVRSIGKYLNIEEKYINEAVDKVNLPCRFEVVSDNPLIILDGAHNVSKIEYSLKKLNDQKYNKLYVVFGVGNTKDAFGMLDIISSYTKNIRLTFTDKLRDRSFSLKKMKEYISSNYQGIDVSVELSPHKTLSDLEKNITNKDAILVIGSLYLTGDIRKKWYSEEYIIKNRRSF